MWLRNCIWKKNKKKQSDITGYSLKTRKKTKKTKNKTNNKDYILKNLSFDGNRLVQKQRKQFDGKYVIFIKYQGDFVPYKLNITKAYYDKISNTNDKRNMNELFFDIVFPNPTI